MFPDRRSFRLVSGAFSSLLSFAFRVECELRVCVLRVEFLWGFDSCCDRGLCRVWGVRSRRVRSSRGVAMDLLVLFPLECLANLPGSKPVVADVDPTRVKKLSLKKTSEEEEEKKASDELEAKAKLRFEFLKIPALLSLKPN